MYIEVQIYAQINWKRVQQQISDIEIMKKIVSMIIVRLPVEFKARSEKKRQNDIPQKMVFLPTEKP